MTHVRKETLYQILDIDRTASSIQIQSQFEELETFWESLYTNSPREAEWKLMEIRNAFSILSDANSREIYDETLDFEFVLLDGKTKDQDMEDAYEVYRHNHQKSYQEIFQEFHKFKGDLGGSLWMLKSTTLYLIFSVFSYSGFILLLSLLIENGNESSHSFLRIRNFLLPVYFLFTCVGYYFFRKYFQIPSLKKRKSKITEA
jgi:hypothetical protein